MSDAPSSSPRFDRATHLRKNLDALDAMLHDERTLIVPLHRTLHAFVGDARTELHLPTLAEAAELIDAAAELVWLGELDGRAVFAADVTPIGNPLNHRVFARHSRFDELMTALPSLPTWQAELACYARALLFWHARHQYCGACAQPTRARDGGHVRKCTNSACGLEHFPRTDPAIIVLVTHGDRCLLGRQRVFPRGMYSTLAGFVEPGETLEEAVVREMREEAGVLVKNVRYFKSQPWPFPASLMLGFVAEAENDVLAPDDDELEHVAWFTRDEIASPTRPDFFVPPKYSVSGQLIAHFMEEKNGGVP
jgi:NAD+ diphosphatase